MVDSNDRERSGEAKDELARMLNEDELRDAILLVFANKQVIYPKQKANKRKNINAIHVFSVDYPCNQLVLLSLPTFIKDGSHKTNVVAFCPLDDSH